MDQHQGQIHMFLVVNEQLEGARGVRTDERVEERGVGMQDVAYA